MREKLQTFVREQARMIVLVLGAAGILLLFALFLHNQNSLRGIPPEDPAVQALIGEQNAPIVTVYTDPLCPQCKNLHESTLAKVKEEYVNKGKIQLDMRPMSIVDEVSTPLVEYMLCSHDQDAFWASSEHLYTSLYRENNKEPQDNGYAFFDDYPVETLARTLDIDKDTLQSCIDNDTYLNKVDEANMSAYSQGVVSTPTIFVPGVDTLRGFITYEELQPHLDALVAQHSARENRAQ